MKPAYRFGTQSPGVIRSLETGSQVYGILTISSKRFEAWRRGTERCLEEAPVTRKRAIEIHCEERRKSGAWS